MYSSCTSRTSMNVSVDCWVSATNHFFYLFSKTLCSLSDSLTFLSTVSLFFDSTLMNDIVHCTMYDIRFVLVCVCVCVSISCVCMCVNGENVCVHVNCRYSWVLCCVWNSVVWTCMRWERFVWKHYFLTLSFSPLALLSMNLLIL